MICYVTEGKNTLKKTEKQRIREEKRDTKRS